VAALKSIRQQQMTDFVRDRACEHERGRHVVLRGLRFHAPVEDVGDPRAVRRAGGRAHHGLRTLLKIAGFVRDHDDVDRLRLIAAQHARLRPFDVDADVAIDAHDFSLRLRDGGHRHRRRV
jgi:hypothetical protein